MIDLNWFFSQSHLPSLRISLNSSRHPPSPNFLMPRHSPPMIKPATSGTSKNRTCQTNALIAWNSILILEASYVLQWLKVWWALRHVIITCQMLQMSYLSLLRQPQSQANAGKPKCGRWGIFLGQVFLSIFCFKIRSWVNLTIPASLESALKWCSEQMIRLRQLQIVLNSFNGMLFSRKCFVYSFCISCNLSTSWSFCLLLS